MLSVVKLFFDIVKLLTVHVEGDGCAFARGDSLVGRHAAVIPPCVAVNRLNRQVASCGHPLPVREHLLAMEGKETFSIDNFLSSSKKFRTMCVRLASSKFDLQ